MKIPTKPCARYECPVCDRVFYDYNKRRTCSRRCQEALRENSIFECRLCGKKVIRRKRGARGLYCSKECRKAYRAM